MTARVLIVDDDAAVRELLARFLDSEGYEPILASGGANALALLEHLRPPPAILLLDLVMPDVDGYAVLAHLCDQGRDDLPILIFSGYQVNADLLTALDVGCRDFIAKPLDVGELHVRLQRLLHRAYPAVWTPTAPVRVYALGTLRVYQGDTLLFDERWRNKLAKSLFKLLLTTHGQRVAKEALVEELWPDADPESALNRLRVTIHDLRHRLQTGAPPAGALRLIEQNEGSYAFDPAHECWTDVRAFEEALQRGHALARQGQTAEALAAYQQGEALYASDYLRDDPFAEWSLAMRERLREDYLDLLAALGRLHAESGDLDNAVHRCRQILRLEPWREEAYRGLMGHLAAAGRRSEALRVFEECRRALAAEGLEPACATRRLRDRLAEPDEDALPPGAPTGARRHPRFPGAAG